MTNINLIFATSNQNKVLEIQKILPKKFNIKSLKDLNYFEDVPENENTIEGNAVFKAKYIYKKFNINVFADDTGLEVDELALMCDVLIASTEAKFADTHARVGIMPGWGLSQRLPRLIGISRAKQVSLTGNFVDANTAERWGLVNSVHSPAELLPTALKIAEDMAGCMPHMLKGYKQVIDEGFGMNFDEALVMESRRSAKQSASVSKESVEAARKAVTTRGQSLQ